MEHNRIVIAEDEVGLREAVVFLLEKNGFHVDQFSDGESAWESVRSNVPDVVILDIMMPRMDGLALCRAIRGISVDVPIMFLTSKDEEFDRVLGLELGADDYLTKPFSMRELLARVRALLRRRSLSVAPASSPQRIRHGPLALEPDGVRAWWAGTLVPLTVTEFRVLLALVQATGAVKSRAQLLDAAYPEDLYVAERSVDCHIRRIRKKLAEIHPETDCIQTVYGAGYRYQPAASIEEGR